MYLSRCIVATVVLLPSCALAAAAADRLAPTPPDPACMQRGLDHALDSLTLGELRRRCQQNPRAFPDVAQIKASTKAAEASSVSTPKPAAVPQKTASVHDLDIKISLEASAAENPFGITPYLLNYVLPYSYGFRPNYAAQNLREGDLQHEEVVFQLSYQVPVWSHILGENLDLYFAYTNRSFWQVYNEDRSRPFRETNHQPEFFLTWHDAWKPGFVDHAEYNFGLVHQSNGRSDPFSRSWNRVYIFPRLQSGNFHYGLKLWYRLPERRKRSPNDAGGDDNPDILHFMGNFELYLGYVSGRQSYTMMLRNNLESDNKGAIRLGYSFPINDTLYGYVQYFDGYGESLIDYNHHNRRLGLGVAFNAWP